MTIIAEDPKFVGLLKQAVARFQGGDVEAAVSLCEQALNERKEEPEALHLMATILASAGRYRQALPFARCAADQQPENPRYLQTLGRLLREDGDPASAEEVFRRSAKVDPTAAAAWLGIATTQQLQGQAEQAIQTLREASARLTDPAVFRAHAAALASAGRLDEAAQQLQNILAQAPQDAIALNNLGIVRIRQGQASDAQTWFSASLGLNPANTVALSGLSLALQATGEFDKALVCSDEVMKIRALTADEWAHRGSVLLSLGRKADALSAFESALSLDASHAHSGGLAGKAEILERAGQYEAALELLARAADPNDSMIVLARTQLLRRTGRPSDALALLDPHVQQQRIDGPLLRPALFTLAELRDEVADYDLAFRHAQDAHAINPKSFDSDRHRLWIDKQISGFSRNEVKKMTRADSVQPGLLFVVGMPRSGTSLVEQILGCHSAIYPAGERSDIGVQARELLSAESGAVRDDISSSELTAVARDYLQALGELPAATRFVTDKMPLNFLYLGLINALFPDARIVHCRRNILDTALSCFFTDFQDPALAFSEKLEDLGDYIRQYQRLMAHWMASLDIKIHELDYEQLVTEQEKTTRALIEFTGLDWDEKCLNYQESERAVDTASHAQVRKAIYQSSLGRSQHYRNELAELRAMLEGE